MINLKNPTTWLPKNVKENFIGIRVIADVHGSIDAFEEALTAAARDNRYVIQLGDLVDRGPYSPFCVERMLEIEAQGCGAMLMGNHEIAFAHFLLEAKGGAVTRQATLLQFEEYGERLAQRYVERIQEGPLWIRTDDLLFVHAAFHPRMLNDDLKYDPIIHEIAIHGFGTSHQRRSNNKDQEREWVHSIPKGLTVIVGHRVTSSGTVESAIGRQGGKAIFAETGIWRSDASFPIIDFNL